MASKTVAVMTPGDMGHAVAGRMIEGGLEVVTNLTGRSQRSKDLAAKVGITDLKTDGDLLSKADVVLSIMVPSEAVGFAKRMAKASEEKSARPIFVDCNAIAPQTAREVGQILGSAGFPVIDGGIIGGPPYPGRKSPRIYVSGHRLGGLEELKEAGLDIREVGGGIGGASGLKMCYASLTKGFQALGIQAMTVAKSLGIEEDFEKEMLLSQADVYERLHNWLPSTPPKAYRFHGEMEEIGKTAEDVGLSPRMFQGAADHYRTMEASPLGKEIVEDRKLGTTAEEIAEIMAEFLKSK